MNFKKGNEMCKEQPYLFEKKEVYVRKYNINFGDHRICQCDHPYYDHFAEDADMLPCGCNLCECFVFMEKETNASKIRFSTNI